MDEPIYITHPDIEGSLGGPVEAASFPIVWEPRGWVITATPTEPEDGLPEGFFAGLETQANIEAEREAEAARAAEAALAASQPVSGDEEASPGPGVPDLTTPDSDPATTDTNEQE